MQIAILTDLHYGEPCALPERRCEIADALLRRAVHGLNHRHRPDVTLVLGDVLDNGQASDAHERRAQLRATLDELHSPSIVIPGNHDGPIDEFYMEFERPADIVDIGGVRFLPFLDPEEPGCNASRTQHDIDRFRLARADYDGPIVALQHVCLAPPDLADIPYNYTNASAVVDAMNRSGVALSVSGHHHAGGADLRWQGMTFVNAPSLCEAPFQYVIVNLDGNRTASAWFALDLPKV
jgi:3',5'-cyclic AMP phosphodiesterase CpdA